MQSFGDQKKWRRTPHEPLDKGFSALVYQLQKALLMHVLKPAVCTPVEQRFD